MPIPRLIIALGIMSTTTIAYGSLWEDNDWAVVGTMNGSVGYDSNLTLVHDGPSATLIIANPYLTLERHNSDGDFNINGGVTETEFADSNLPLETDLAVSANYSYPKADYSTPNGVPIIPIFDLATSWVRSSQPNEFLGERVQNDLTTVTGKGYVTLTGKLGLRADGQFQAVTFDSSSLNNSYDGQVSVGLAYERTQQNQISLNFGTNIGHSRPNDPANFVSNVRGVEYYATGRIEGQITDKISGSAYGGFGEVTYSGGYSNHTSLPVAGADLTWGIDPRRTLVLAAYSGAEFSPDGEAVDNTKVFLSYTDVIIDRWQYILRTGPTYTQFRRQTLLRTDDIWNYGIEFAYEPSNRFRIYLSLDYTNHASTIPAYAFGHEIVSLGCSYHF